MPRVWRASRATLGARRVGLRGLVLRIVCVPAEKLHFGLTFRLWADFAEIVYRNAARPLSTERYRARLSYCGAFILVNTLGLVNNLV